MEKFNEKYADTLYCKPSHTKPVMNEEIEEEIALLRAIAHAVKHTGTPEQRHNYYRLRYSHRDTVRGLTDDRIDYFPLDCDPVLARLVQTGDAYIQREMPHESEKGVGVEIELIAYAKLTEKGAQRIKQFPPLPPPAGNTDQS